MTESRQLTITPNHIRTGLEWYFGRFYRAVALSDDEAARLLNSSTENLTNMRNQLSDAEAFELLPGVVERLSLLLGIYGAIARIAPDGPSRFVYVAFREAPRPEYDGRTLVEYLLNANSLDTWYTVRSYLRTMEARFLG